MAVTIRDIEKLTAIQMGKRRVSAANHFMKDLGAESADMVNIIANVEDKFQISFEHLDLAAITTVQELFELVKKNEPKE